ncbi:MAG: hypothetical protein H6657_06890 [Ardenticatenaceae bacterium]|nr:hypothetical protein [Ardenticatenaceae bacterium]
MYRKLKLTVLVLFVSLFLFQQTALAQDGPSAQHTDAVWQVSYWNNKTLSGNPVVQTTETDINWDWGTGGPSGLPADGFSARWSKYIDVAAGTYRFTTTADDGIRVYVDNSLVINQWSDHPAQTFTADVALSAGHHQIMVEYYENGGFAVAKLTWGPKPNDIVNWKGEYFNNRTLTGSPTLVRDDANINFNWGNGVPANGMSNDNFSVRWTRTINFPAGSYRFTTTSDDGVRLWVNGHLLIDKWFDQAASTYSGVIYLSGNVAIQMEYYENGGLAVAQLGWSLDNGNPTPPPSGSVIIDNTSSGFIAGGTASSWRSSTAGYNGGMLWTYNNDYARNGYNWARWYPSLTAGRYELFVYIPAKNATATTARYWVSHRDGFTLKVVNQLAYSDQWVSLGTYWFRGTGSDYVSLSDVTGEAYLSRLVGFDAMKWEAR